MKYKNELNLPEPIVNAVKNDTYDRGEDADYSVTELIDPARKKTLEKKHADELEMDVADGIFALLGQSVHTILERAGVPEKRFAIEILQKTVTGKIDRFKDGLLQDWKVTSAYRFKDGKASFETEAQLNCYAEILRQNGKKVERLQAVGILRDWSKLEVLRDTYGSYPKKQVVVIEVPLWTSEECIRYLEERVARHEAAKTELPHCTREERWGKPDVFAVMKEGNKRAVRLFYDDEKGAHEFRNGHKDRTKMHVEHRPPENTRCQSYCNAAPFCEQWKELQAQKNGPSKNPGPVLLFPTRKS